jgi:hypothetical protein
LTVAVARAGLNVAWRAQNMIGRLIGFMLKRIIDGPDFELGQDGPRSAQK